MRSAPLFALCVAVVSCRSASEPTRVAATASADLPQAVLVDLHVETAEVPAFRFLYVECTAPRADVEAALERVEDYAARRDIRQTGSWCGVYFDASDLATASGRTEVGVAVDDELTPDPPFRLRDVDVGLVAFARLHEPGATPAIRAALRRWAADHGYRVVGPVHEISDGPDGLNDAEPETRVLVPISR